MPDFYQKTGQHAKAPGFANAAGELNEQLNMYRYSLQVFIPTKTPDSWPRIRLCRCKAERARRATQLFFRSVRKPISQQ